MEVSNRVFFGKKGFKYFMDYKDDKKIKPLCIFFSKNECPQMKLNMSFFDKSDELLQRYNEFWEKVKNSIKKELDSEYVYNKNT